MRMRKNIILVFLLLLALQVAQILVVSRFIRRHQTAVNRVTYTVQGKEISRTTRNLLEQIRDNVVVIAGMNLPVTGIEKLNGQWDRFTQRFHAMLVLAEDILQDPSLLKELNNNMALARERKKLFEQAVLGNASDPAYASTVRDAAFQYDEAMADLKDTLDLGFEGFVQQETKAVMAEEKIHDLPIQTVTAIGAVIAAILIIVGILTVTKIVNPLINLMVQYRITAKRLKKEREISLALEKAQAAAQARSEFLANMSHELRTPMNTILGFSELLQKTELNEKQKGYLQLILTSGRHLVELINDILDFSKFEAGKIELESISMNLRHLASDVMNMMKIKTREKGLDIYIDYPDHIITHIKSDPTRLKQVLVNLCNNAAKFTHEGQIGIIVREEKDVACAEDEVALRISVKDSGIGIPKEKITKIFEEFTQADASTTRKYGGTGLGLSISKSIVEAMGGRLWVESEEGKGSEFIMTVNFKKGSAEEEERTDPQITRKLAGKKAFIVDDNEISRRVNKEVSEAIGLEVLDMADSGSAALAKLDALAQRGVVPDVILCDIMMANMDGYEMSKKVRANKVFKNVKIVAVTVREEEGASGYIKDSCFDGYLPKPLVKKEMIQCLGEIFGYTAEQQSTIADDSDAFKGLKILVAEDTLFNQKLLQAILEKLQCAVDFAKNGQVAVQKAEAREYDLILMDLQMPVMGGIEAAQKIRQGVSSNVPIIALTAAVMKEDRLAAQKAGMNDFIEKPINTAELKNKIFKYTRARTSRA